MRLWGRTLSSSGRCQLAPRPLCLCRTEALLQALPQASEQTLLTSAGDQTVRGWAVRKLPLTAGDARG